jgi:hypothetical protein
MGTRERAVMSASPYLKNPKEIGFSAAVRQRSFAFSCGVSLVIYWSKIEEVW